ncbi:MAG: hypothetical protein IPL92_11240 [Saprospiraceae bacterium]|nr:hypothetical protein [Candidatus Opimibacter iunctus]
MSNNNDTTAIGDAGAQKTMARLQVACFANVSPGTYSEDSMKCDILFTFKNAFDSAELCKLAGQIKTGNSFIKLNPGQSTARIDNCSDVKEVMAKFGHPIIIFVVADKKDIHWYSGDFRSKKIDIIKIPAIQIISPSIWVDFSRLHRYWQYQHNKYLSQTLSLKKVYIKECKDAFKELQSTIINNPIIGPISITKKSWEHVTRQGRTKLMREFSIRTAKHLKHFLETNPDRIALKYISKMENDGTTIEKRQIIMHYRKGVEVNKKTHGFAIRIDEVIKYPSNWIELTLLTSDVTHIRKVSSWWLGGMKKKRKSFRV